jgi:hypothetical protein
VRYYIESGCGGHVIAVVKIDKEGNQIGQVKPVSTIDEIPNAIMILEQTNAS